MRLKNSFCVYSYQPKLNCWLSLAAFKLCDIDVSFSRDNFQNKGLRSAKTFFLIWRISPFLFFVLLETLELQCPTFSRRGMTIHREVTKGHHQEPSLLEWPTKSLNVKRVFLTAESAANWHSQSGRAERTCFCQEELEKPSQKSWENFEDQRKPNCCQRFLNQSLQSKGLDI